MSYTAEKLRCTHCGAPLPQLRQNENFVKCEYCGYLNRVTDSATYVERLKREISAWISQILPHQVIVSTVADPVARHHLFQGYVKPKLIPTSVNAKTTYVETMYKPFIAFDPFYKQTCKEPRSLFEESIKLESISELAVSDEDKSFLSDTRRHLLVSAYVCNALMNAYEEKYSESVRNIDESLRLVESTEDRVLTTRLKIAKSTYTALSELYNRNTSTSLSIIQSVVSLLNELTSSRDTASISKYLAAIEIEKDLVSLLKSIIEIAHVYFENGLDPLTPVSYLKNALVHIAKNVMDFNRPLKDALETVEHCKKSILSTFKRERVKILGKGDLYLPFYAVGASITYTSGLLFKKGYEVGIDLLVSATHPVLTGLTDVFEVYSGGLINLDKESEKLKAISNLLVNAREDYLGKNTVLPLISHVIAESMVDKYLDIVRAKYHGKLKLSTTQARELIYVGCYLDKEAVKINIPVTLFTGVDVNKLKDVTI